MNDLPLAVQGHRSGYLGKCGGNQQTSQGKCLLEKKKKRLLEEKESEKQTGGKDRARGELAKQLRWTDPFLNKGLIGTVHPLSKSPSSPTGMSLTQACTQSLPSCPVVESSSSQSMG